MSHTTSSKNFPAVLETIQRYQLEGVLACDPLNGQLVQLFFRRGIMVYACTEREQQSADEALHELLGWDVFKIEWVPLAVRIAEPNVSEETYLALLDVLQVLIANGKFGHPQHSHPHKEFWGLALENSKIVKAVSPVKTTVKEPVKEPVKELLTPKIVSNSPIVATVETVDTKTATKVLAQTTGNSQTKSTSVIETNLLLPAGLHQNQLEELLRPVGLKEQLTILRQMRFTGYVYYNLNQSKSINRQANYGLALFNDGQLTDLVYYTANAETNQSGKAAFENLAVVKLKPEIYKVAAPIMRAYRAVINGEKPYAENRVTKDNFTTIVKAFKEYRRDGIILLYLDSLKLYYFFLFDGGQQVGIFGPEFKTGRLEQLSAPLALPASDEKAWMTVMLVKKEQKPDLLEDLVEPTPIKQAVTAPAKETVVKRDAFSTGTLKNVDNSILGQVDWGGIFSNPTNPEARLQAGKSENLRIKE